MNNSMLIKQIERLKCPVHLKHADASFVNGKLNTSACCDKLEKKIQELVLNHMTKPVNELLKNIFS